MIGKVKRLKLLLLAFVVAATPLFAMPSVFAASASLSLSGGGSVAKGATVTMGIYVNGDAPVSVVKANLSYPADKLDFLGITNSSAFEIVAGNSGGGGNISVDRGTFSAKAGRSLVASVRLKAKVDTGSASVAIVSGDVAGPSSLNTNWLGGKSGANITFKAPATPTPAAPEPPKDTVAPTMKDVTVAETSANSVTITWTTSEPATSIVDYGLTTAYGFTATDTALVTDHKVVLNSPNMEPGVSYHFLVKSADGAGNAVADSDKTFTTKGATLVATIVNKKNKPLAGAELVIGSETNKGTTDKDGKVTIEGLQVGKALGVVTYKGKKAVVNVEIKPIDPANPQTETFSVDITNQNMFWLFVIPPIILLLLLGAALYMLKRKGHDNPWKGLKDHASGFGAGIAAKMPKKAPSTVVAKPAPVAKPEPPVSASPYDEPSKLPAGPTLVKPTISIEPPTASGTGSGSSSSKKQ